MKKTQNAKSFAKLCLLVVSMWLTTTAAIGQANFAPLGIGRTWNDMGNFALTNNTAVDEPGINDGNLTTDVSLAEPQGATPYQAVGVVWATAKTNITSVKFYSGTCGADGGHFTSALSIQTSTNGTTWEALAGWTCSPVYPYTVGASNQTYTFSGTAISTNIKGIRIVGRVTDAGSEWRSRCKEFQVIGTDATAPSTPATALTVSNLGSKGLTLSWTAAVDNIGIASYEVFRGGTISCGTVSGATTNLTISGLTPSTAYSFTVKAIDGAGLTATSAAVAATTTAYVVGQYGFLENFNDNVLTNWTAGNYVLTEAGGVLKINPIKTSAWDAFDLKFSATQIDISSAPYLSLKIKSNIDFNIVVGIGKAGGSIDNYPLKFNNTLFAGAQEVVASGEYQTYTFDFTGIAASVLQTANNLHFLFNPLTSGFGSAASKEIYFEDVKVGDLAVRTPAISTIQEQVFTAQASGSTPRVVKFRNVTDGSTGTNAITITATSSNTSVIPNPTVTYTSPSATGSLTLNPVLSAAGTSTITVTVTAANTTPKVMTFLVKVVPNAAPTIEAIPNVVAKKGTAVKLPINKISDGNAESTQNVTVTATSSNTAVVPSVSVSHAATD